MGNVRDAGGDNPSSDLLYGVPAIAEYLNMRERQCRARIERREIPTFKIGGTICSRKGILDGWLAECEAKALADTKAAAAARAEKAGQ